MEPVIAQVNQLKSMLVLLVHILFSFTVSPSTCTSPLILKPCMKLAGQPFASLRNTQLYCLQTKRSWPFENIVTLVFPCFVAVLGVGVWSSGAQII